MVRTELMPTRDRIVTEAMLLFAHRGYAATSITAIEEASGLSKGAGGIYRHFPSKRAVLEEGLRRAMLTDAGGGLLNPDFEVLPLDQALLVLARFSLVQLESQRQLMRVLFREMDPFPDLLGEVRDWYIQVAYRVFADWLQRRIDDGQVRPLDTEATAALFLGSLVNYRIIETFLGETPAQVDEERMIAAWAENAHRALSAASSPPTTSR